MITLHWDAPQRRAARRTVVSQPTDAARQRAEAAPPWEA
jgi:hypothetical protein